MWVFETSPRLLVLLHFLPSFDSDIPVNFQATALISLLNEGRLIKLNILASMILAHC